jgi:hypothetical protein
MTRIRAVTTSGHFIRAVDTINRNRRPAVLSIDGNLEHGGKHREARSC